MANYSQQVRENFYNNIISQHYIGIQNYWQILPKEG